MGDEEATCGKQSLSPKEEAASEKTAWATGAWALDGSAAIWGKKKGLAALWILFYPFTL
jgi:hypothetical protein